MSKLQVTAFSRHLEFGRFTRLRTDQVTPN